MKHCPQDKKTGLQWLISPEFSEEVLAKDGSKLHNSDWIYGVYAWFFGRMSDSRKAQYPPPLKSATAERPYADSVPFPTAKLGAEAKLEDSHLSFLSVDTVSIPCSTDPNAANSGSKSKALEAAVYVYNVFRQFNPKLGYPQVKLAELPVEGGSLALSAMIAALGRILDIEIPNNLIATGCCSGSSRSCGLQTVAPETLAQKICAAVRYGYRDFLFVQGQKGCWKTQLLSPHQLFNTLKQVGILPEDTKLTFHEVSKQPFKALFKILCMFPANSSENLATFLTVLSYQNLWANPQFHEILRSQSRSKSNLVRHVALDLLSGCQVNCGDALKGAQHYVDIPQLSPKEFPIGLLGNYLKYEEASTHVILNLDCGNWDENEPNYKRTLEILEWHEKCARKNMADLEDLRLTLFLSNRVARHLFFRGKLQWEPKLIKQAWKKLIGLRCYWDDIFQYTREQGRVNEDANWQRNLCLECLESYWGITQKRLEPFPDAFELSEEMNAYDLTAWLRWNVIRRKPQDISILRCLQLADKIYAKEKRGPEDYKPYEKIVLYKLGTPEEQAHAREQLKKAEHFANVQNAKGIMTILAMRTAVVLQDKAKLDAAIQVVPASLQWLAHELSTSPERLPARCPY